jgi:hypothetical protein
MSDGFKRAAAKTRSKAVVPGEPLATHPVAEVSGTSTPAPARRHPARSGSWRVYRLDSGAVPSHPLKFSPIPKTSVKICNGALRHRCNEFGFRQRPDDEVGKCRLLKPVVVPYQSATARVDAPSRAFRGQLDQMNNESDVRKH